LEEGSFAGSVDLVEGASKLFTVLFGLPSSTWGPKRLTTGTLDLLEILLELLAVLLQQLDLSFQIGILTLPSLQVALQPSQVNLRPYRSTSIQWHRWPARSRVPKRDDTDSAKLCIAGSLLPTAGLARATHSGGSSRTEKEPLGGGSLGRRVPSM
jgi:hypothetical protein